MAVGVGGLSQRAIVSVLAVVAGLWPAAGSAANLEASPLSDRARAVRLMETFSAWAATWKIADASAVVMRGDRVLASAARGARGPRTPVVVASLSKAITGVCVTKLVEAGRLSADDRIGTVLAPFFKTRPPKDKRALDVTIGQLLTHSSGITYDPSQTPPPGTDPTRPQYALQLGLTLEKPLGTAPGSSFSYNNMNYVALAMAVEATVGEAYETHCRKSVLDPAGVRNAQVDPGLRILGPYGGWQISALDYAKFTDHFRPSSGLLASGPAEWPAIELVKRPPVSYQIGVLTRPRARSYDMWHFGALTLQDLNVSAGGLFKVWGQSLRFSANWGADPDDKALSDLFERLDAIVIP